MAGHRGLAYPKRCSDDYTASADHMIIVGYEQARVRRTRKMMECDVANVVGVEGERITKLVALAPRVP